MDLPIRRGTTVSGVIDGDTLSYVRFIDSMPSVEYTDTSFDQAVVDGARVSVNNKGRSPNRALLRTLMRERHTSPFEQVQIKFEVQMPIFVGRQWIRHRTASPNEFSARYSEVPEDYFMVPDPSMVFTQSQTNKQGGNNALDRVLANQFSKDVAFINQEAYRRYQNAIKAGMSREKARILLPQTMYTRMFWSINLHNLLHFTQLRISEHAQREIRVYAQVIYDMLQELAPLTMEAFDDYCLHAMTLSRPEQLLLGAIHRLPTLLTDDNAARQLSGLSATELVAFRRKCALLMDNGGGQDQQQHNDQSLGSAPAPQ